MELAREPFNLDLDDAFGPTGMHRPSPPPKRDNDERPLKETLNAYSPDRTLDEDGTQDGAPEWMGA
jgi:hypothetical protein